MLKPEQVLERRELSAQELAGQQLAEMPERAVLSLVNLNLAAPINAAVAANVLSDGSAAEITTTRFLSPSGSRLLGEGVKPNEAVTLDATELAQGYDRPLERALALLG